MDHDEALKLLRGGEEGVREWNRRREVDEAIPDLRYANLSHADLACADLSNANLSSTNLSDANLQEADLSGANLQESNLSGAILFSASLNEANLTGADLRHAEFNYASLEGVDLREVDFRDVDLRGAELRAANLCGTDFRGTNVGGGPLGGWLRNTNLRDTNLTGADLTGADLAGADLSNANLSHADLAGADLSNANLSHAILSGAILSDADLSHADLSGAILFSASLNEANLTGADLTGADLAGADLSNANLSSTNLSDANLSDADLSGNDLRSPNLQKANLSGLDFSTLSTTTFFNIDFSGVDFSRANLTLTRFIECNLEDAVFNDAIVTNIDIQDLRGLPKLSERLRLDRGGNELILTGSEAKEFFHLPAIVEVYLTAELTPQELGCYHFHLGEVHHESVATGVYLVGHRYEGGGSILRFQAKSYDEIYQVLPDLLAPFRMAEALDWERTIQAMPAKNHGDAITTLVKMETKRPTGRWRFAERMAEIFRGYRQARVYQISEGRNQGLRIDVFTNHQIADRLSRVALPEPWDTQQKVRIETGGGASTIQVIEGNYMSEQHIHGGHFQGCSFGDYNSLTNYFGVVDNLGTVEEDIKQKLKESRQSIENSDLPNDDKADMVEQLNNLTGELEKPDADSNRVQRFWNRIKETAPTVASILASAASLGKILGFG